MKFITFLNLITLAGLLFLISIFLIPLVFLHSIDNCCQALPPDPDYHPVITNTTNSDPIFGHWIFPDDKNPFHPVDIAFRSDGYVGKLKNVDNFTFTQIRGPWTKVAENTYFIQWIVELEMSRDHHVNGSFIPINETISYDSSMDRINVGGNYYIRKNVTMIDESSNYNK